MANVTLRDIVKIYGEFVAIKGIDLDIEDGTFVVLVGPSGCGKSTLLRMIAGLETISHGELRIGGKLVNDLPSRERGISMVFQSYALYPHMSVRDNLGFGLKISGVSKGEIERRRGEAASMLGLSPYMDRRPSQLRHIIWPLLLPTVLVVTILNVAAGFTTFDLLWVMAADYPGKRTLSLAVYMYYESFSNGAWAYGSAIAVVLGAMVIAVSAVLAVIQARVSQNIR